MVNGKRNRVTAKAGRDNLDSPARGQSNSAKNNSSEQIQESPVANLKESNKQAAKGSGIRVKLDMAYNTGQRTILRATRRGLNNNARPCFDEVQTLSRENPDDNTKVKSVQGADANSKITESDNKEEELDFDSIDKAIDEADNVVVNVNAYDDDFPSDDEMQDEEIDPNAADTGLVEVNMPPNSLHTQQLPMSDQIGNVDNLEFWDDTASTYQCDSEVNFRIPQALRRNQRGRMPVLQSNNSENIYPTAAEMLEQLQNDNPGFMMLMNHFIEKKLQEASPGTKLTAKGTVGPPTASKRVAEHSQVTPRRENEVVAIPAVKSPQIQQYMHRDCNP